VVFSQKRMNKARVSTPMETSRSSLASRRSCWSSRLAIADSRRSSASGDRNDAMAASAKPPPNRAGTA
jgi:hypothetical protein